MRNHCARVADSLNKAGISGKDLCFKIPSYTTNIAVFMEHIFVFVRNDCARVADSLNEAGISAVAYHAGLSDEDRTKCQEAWINNRYKVSHVTVEQMRGSIFHCMIIFIYRQKLTIEVSDVSATSWRHCQGKLN